MKPPYCVQTHTANPGGYARSNVLLLTTIRLLISSLLNVSLTGCEFRIARIDYEPSMLQPEQGCHVASPLLPLSLSKIAHTIVDQERTRTADAKRAAYEATRLA
jgi:hypothetical protein